MPPRLDPGRSSRHVLREVRVAGRERRDVSRLLIRGLRDQYARVLERGGANLDHIVASDEGYRVTTGLAGRRVLLIDDTFTTGAWVQSAASALTLGGAAVVAVVAIGRVINPEFSGMSRALWERACASRFDFEVHRVAWLVIARPSVPSSVGMPVSLRLGSESRQR